MLMFFVISIIFTLISLSVQYNDVFNEELFIKPLSSGHINTFFQFTTKWQYDHFDNLHHTHLAPRAVAEIFHEYNIRELHISLTNGLWRYENWGYPVIDAAPGAEVWAWFDDTSHNINDNIINEQWKNLCSTLSGLLCASLSFIDHTNTLQPHYSYKPQFYSRHDINSTFIRYSSLPHEVVCTENITPWKKLLPCGQKEGFISLLNSDYIHSTNYHSIGIHVRQLCGGNKKNGQCTKKLLEIKQTVNLIYDQLLIGGKDWSIRKLFGQGLNRACPLAETSKIYVDITNFGDSIELAPKPYEFLTSTRGGFEVNYAVYDAKLNVPNKMFNLAAIRKNNVDTIVHVSPPPLFAKRFILGVGQERGKIMTKISNTHWSELSVIVQENIPWFVPIYLHSLKLKAGSHEIKPVAVVYIPGEQRKRAYHLEVAFKIPPRSSVELSIDFDYIFLKWQEYPPDANHGHYLGSATVTALLPIAKNYTGVSVDGSLFADSFNASRSGYYIQIRTESLLLTLPTPDFSMPYNVICLACTVVALAFGPIHNISTKKIVIKNKDAPKSLLGKLKQKLFNRKKQVTNLDEQIDDNSDKKIIEETVENVKNK